MKSTDELLKILKNYNNTEEFIEDNTEEYKKYHLCTIHNGMSE